MPYRTRSALLGLVLAALAAGPAEAAPGDLDASYGSGGAVAAGLRAERVAVAADDVAVVASGSAHRRLTADGSPAPGFEGGPARLDWGPSRDPRTSDVAVDGAGRTLAAGSVQHHYNTGFRWGVVSRSLPGGEPDRCFGDDGFVLTAFGGENSNERVLRAAVDPLGRILLLLEVGARPVVARLLPNGAVDTSFGTGGIVRIRADARVHEAYIWALLPMPDSSVLLAGRDDSDAIFLKLTAAGTSDSAFGENGITRMPEGPGGRGYSPLDLAHGPEGTVAVAGRSGDNAGDNVFWAARLRADGAIDSAFGGPTGVLVSVGVDPDGRSGAASSVAVQRNGKVVIAGHAGYERDGDHQWRGVVARLRPDGSLDAGFGDGGTTMLEHVIDPPDVALQQDGRILVAAQRALIRLEGDGADGGPYGPPPAAGPAETCEAPDEDPPADGEDPPRDDTTGSGDPSPPADPVDEESPAVETAEQQPAGETSGEGWLPPSGQAAPVITQPATESHLWVAPPPPLRVTAAGHARVRVPCARARRCRGTIRLQVDGARIAFKRFDLRPRTGRRVAVRLNRPTRRRVQGGQALQARLIVRVGQRRARASRHLLVPAPR